MRFAILHPYVWLRAWLLRRDRRRPDLPSKLPASLEGFTVGESFPIKGTWLTVGKVIGGEFPCIILVPRGVTRGKKLKALRDVRDLGRTAIKQRRRTAAALRKAT